MNTTRSLLPHFRNRRSGTVIFIGSMGAWRGNPVAGCYTASKSALRGLIEVFTQEVEPLGIRSLLVEPGYFRTELIGASNAVFGDGA